MGYLWLLNTGEYDMYIYIYLTLDFCLRNQSSNAGTIEDSHMLFRFLTHHCSRSFLGLLGDRRLFDLRVLLYVASRRTDLLKPNRANEVEDTHRFGRFLRHGVRGDSCLPVYGFFGWSDCSFASWAFCCVDSRVESSERYWSPRLSSTFSNAGRVVLCWCNHTLSQ